MLYYNRINVSEGIDINKTSVSKKCDICHYWYFLEREFQFQHYVCNGCHDVLMISMNLSNIAILKVHGVDYRCIIIGISKTEATKLMQNIDFSKKVEHYKT